MFVEKGGHKNIFFITFFGGFQRPAVFICFGINVNVNECRVIYAFRFWIRALISLNRKEETKLWSFNIGLIFCQERGDKFQIIIIHLMVNNFF